MSGSRPLRTPQVLVNGTQQGISAFLSDIGNAGASSLALPSLFEPLSLFTAAMSPTAGVGNLATAFNPTDIVNTLTKVVANDYAVLLPTADIGLAITTSVPAYDVSLFVDQLEAGNLVNAVGDPLAADMALGTPAAGFGFDVIAPAVSSALSALTS